MLSTVFLIARISVFRSNPQELSASPWLPIAMAMLCIAVSLRPGSDPAFAFVLALAQLVVLAALVSYALRRRGFAERMNQTLSALFGVLAVVNLATRPVLAWMESADGSLLWMPMIAGTLLLLWMLAVMVHVLHQALETPLVATVVLCLLMLGIVLASTIVLLSLRVWMLDR
jgi:hypothetical protein